jgi:hypothetical protein
MVETLVVALIVLAAALYAAWALLPGTTRRSLALRGAQTLDNRGSSGVARRIASWLRKLATTPAGGCSDCAAGPMTPAERAKRPPPNPGST